MQSKSKKEAQPQTISQLWFVILIVAVGWSRYLPLSHPELYNFTPVLALFFISGVYLRGHLSWIGPVVAVIASDLVLNPSYGVGLFEPFTLISIFAYLGIFFLGKSIRSSKKIFPIFAGALGSALIIPRNYLWICMVGKPCICENDFWILAGSVFWGTWIRTCLSFPQEFYCKHDSIFRYFLLDFY